MLDAAQRRWGGAGERVVSARAYAARGASMTMRRKTRRYTSEAHAVGEQLSGFVMGGAVPGAGQPRSGLL